MKILFVSRHTSAGLEIAYYPWQRRVYTTEIWLNFVGMPIYRLHHYRIPTQTVIFDPNQFK